MALWRSQRRAADGAAPHAGHGRNADEDRIRVPSLSDLHRAPLPPAYPTHHAMIPWRRHNSGHCALTSSSLAVVMALLGQRRRGSPLSTGDEFSHTVNASAPTFASTVRSSSGFVPRCRHHHRSSCSASTSTRLGWLGLAGRAGSCGANTIAYPTAPRLGHEGHNGP